MSQDDPLRLPNAISWTTSLAKRAQQLWSRLAGIQIRWKRERMATREIHHGRRPEWPLDPTSIAQLAIDGRHPTLWMETES